MKYIITVCFIIIFASGANVQGSTTDKCTFCHSERASSRFYVSLEKYYDSVHGRNDISCIDCHTKKIDHTMGVSEIRRVNCIKCHKKENEHGLCATKQKRLECHFCHTKHGIYEKDNRLSSVHKSQLKNTCSQCHPKQCGEVDILSWLPSLSVKAHSKQVFDGGYEKSNCIGCHQGKGAHGEKERIDEQNCYKCHVCLFSKMRVGSPHVNADMAENPMVFFAGVANIILLGLLLAGGFKFVIHRFGKWGKKDRK